MALEVTILDGYTDEPAGLGVPPYIDVYPRYIAGAVWSLVTDAKVKYYTIDEARRNWNSFFEVASRSKYTIVVAGVVVPGKYLGGNPLTANETLMIGKLLEKTRTFSVLAGPAARFGMGLEGGKPATPPSDFKKVYDAVVTGDPEVYVANLIREGPERAEPWRRRESYDEIEKFILKGTRLILQHPNHGYNLTVELETFRGCSRWVVGGCSFCIEPLYGRPMVRRAENIIREAEALYRLGARSFRLGRQTDILVYGSKKLGEEEFPAPNPEAIERLFRGLRTVIGNSNLHIDNVNPGTIARHEALALKTLKCIVKYHSPGDVAALGLESADERVIAENNLNTSPEETLKAIELVNHVGSIVGWNGLPHLLPGINFILGLPGETRETYRKNLEFLKTLLKRRLMVRRINIRKVMVVPGTRLYRKWDDSILRKHRTHAEHFKWVVRHRFDPAFLKMVVPKGRVLRYVFVELCKDNVSYGRQLGSYPILVEIRGKLKPPRTVNALIVGHKGRSVKAVLAE